MSNLSNKKIARIAGLLYLLMGITGAFGMLYVPSVMIAQGDAATTAANLMAGETLFRVGIVGQLLCQLFFIFLVLALYALLKEVHKTHARVMVILVLVAVPIAFLNTLNQMGALLVLGEADFLSAFDTEQRQALMMGMFKLHENGIFIVEVFWGLWLFPFGYLVYRSGFIPRVLGVLLIIGCFAYLIEHFTALLFPDIRASITPYLMVPLSAGEFSIILWLLIKGVKQPKNE